MTYRIIASLPSFDNDIVIAHRDDLFSAISVYLDAKIAHPYTHVYLQEREPEGTPTRGYVTIRSSKTDER